ncbi:hypothetical protein N7456_008221 [Penicillium angulare]|uniref:Uncharacterized protein n=1 Tax=Penicillium angulare TaxID=116970 RepID=A0A9W9K948_9EURO|nr:hypothetical protein N7456_008221 [Penicillium angulare]
MVMAMTQKEESIFAKLNVQAARDLARHRAQEHRATAREDRDTSAPDGPAALHEAEAGEDDDLGMRMTSPPSPGPSHQREGAAPAAAVTAPVKASLMSGDTVMSHSALIWLQHLTSFSGTPQSSQSCCPDHELSPTRKQLTSTRWLP